MITGKCPECGDPIKAATTQAQFNRNIGLHKRSKHGYVSQHNAKAMAKKRAVAAGDALPEVSPEVAKRRAYQAEWRRNHPRVKNRKQTTNHNSADAQPAFLHQCPNPDCRMKFWMTK